MHATFFSSPSQSSFSIFTGRPDYRYHNCIFTTQLIALKLGDGMGIACMYDNEIPAMALQGFEQISEILCGCCCCARTTQRTFREASAERIINGTEKEEGKKRKKKPGRNERKWKAPTFASYLAIIVEMLARVRSSREYPSKR